MSLLRKASHWSVPCHHCFPCCSALHSRRPIACPHHPVPHFNWSILLKYDSERGVSVYHVNRHIEWWCVCILRVQTSVFVSPWSVILNNVMFSYLFLVFSFCSAAPPCYLFSFSSTVFVLVVSVSFSLGSLSKAAEMFLQKSFVLTVFSFRLSVC